METPKLDRLIAARGHRVRALMAERGLTDEEIADAAKVHVRQVQRVIRGVGSSPAVITCLERRLGADFRAIWFDFPAAA